MKKGSEAESSPILHADADTKRSAQTLTARSRSHSSEDKKAINSSCMTREQRRALLEEASEAQSCRLLNKSRPGVSKQLLESSSGAEFRGI